jgi:pimeloyl-ACP methyl ester carboxylesterase
MICTMKRMMLPAVLVLAAATTGCTPAIPVGTEPWVVAGQGGPVVVFDAGFGATRQSWRPIFPDIAAETTVFAFERPGYRAKSTVVNPADVARDGITTLSEQAQHLHALLGAAKLAPPYVLVGHSLGGTTLLAFAKSYPDEVAGMVFVDGRMPTFTGACKAAGIADCVPPRESLAREPNHLLAERDGFLSTETTEAANVAELGDVPATFIVATVAGDPGEPRSEQIQRVWIQEQRRSAESMRDGRYVEAVGARHNVHHDQPALVIDEIRNMLTRVRTGAWPSP